MVKDVRSFTRATGLLVLLRRSSVVVWHFSRRFIFSMLVICNSFKGRIDQSSVCHVLVVFCKT